MHEQCHAILVQMMIILMIYPSLFFNFLYFIPDLFCCWECWFIKDCRIHLRVRIHFPFSFHFFFFTLFSLCVSLSCEGKRIISTQQFFVALNFSLILKCLPFSAVITECYIIDLVKLHPSINILFAFLQNLLIIPSLINFLATCLPNRISYLSTSNKFLSLFCFE